jgi:MFS family permease
VAATVGPLVGGFLTTFLSWRSDFGLEAAIVVEIFAFLATCLQQHSYSSFENPVYKNKNSSNSKARFLEAKSRHNTDLLLS